MFLGEKKTNKNKSKLTLENVDLLYYWIIFKDPKKDSLMVDFGKSMSKCKDLSFVCE